MIPKNTTKTIRLLLRCLDKNGYNINQIARYAKISAGSAFKIIKELKKNKLVSSKAIGNAIYYSLDLENTETVKLCELVLLEELRLLKGHAKLYAEEVKRFDKAELIIIFGSVLTSKEFNDVDVVFVTDKVRETTSFCLEISKIRAKPVIPLIITKEDIISELKSSKEALTSIIKTGIVVKGESVFLEVVKNAKN